MVMLKMFRDKRVYRVKEREGGKLLLQLRDKDDNRSWLEVSEVEYQAEMKTTFSGDSPMTQVLNVPQKIAIALSTERIEFLKGIRDDEYRENEDVIDLVRCLIEDRVKLRRQVLTLMEQLKQLRKLAQSTEAKSLALDSILDGQEWEVE